MSEHSRQNATVFEHLRSRGPITPRQALNSYGIFRLAARIYDLRQAGHEIIRLWVVNDEGNRFAEYHLLRQANWKAA